MSSALRLSIIMVLLLATTAFGLIAYNMNLPKPQVPVEVTEKEPAAPPTVGYFVAARPLPKGTLARDEVPDSRRPRRPLRRNLCDRDDVQGIIGNKPERSGCEQHHRDD